MEQQKQLYSKQLAAHTLQQLNLVRQQAICRNEKLSTSAKSQNDEGENQGAVSKDRESSPDGEATPRGKQKSGGNKSGKSS